MKILIIGRSQEIVDKVVSGLQASGFDTVGTTNDEEAIAHLRSDNIAAVVIGGGVERASHRKIQLVAAATKATVINGSLGNRDIEKYVQKTLIPILQDVDSLNTSLTR